MAQHHGDINAAGARVVGVSVDSPKQNAAMVEKLLLPFPLLSDPDRSAAIEPYGVANPMDKRNIALPATVVIDPAGEEHYRHVGRDFADRTIGDEVVTVVRSMGLPPTSQEAPLVGPAEPGPTAVKFDHMVPYYRGARFAAVALGLRVPEARENTAAYVSQMDGYIDATKELYRRKQQS